MAKKSLSTGFVAAVATGILLPIFSLVYEMTWWLKLILIVISALIILIIIDRSEWTINIKRWKKFGLSILVILVLAISTFFPIQHQYYIDNPSPKREQSPTSTTPRSLSNLPPAPTGKQQQPITWDTSLETLLKALQNKGLIEGAHFDKEGHLIGLDATAHITGSEVQSKTGQIGRPSKMQQLTDTPILELMIRYPAIYEVIKLEKSCTHLATEAQALCITENARIKYAAMILSHPELSPEQKMNILMQRTLSDMKKTYTATMSIGGIVSLNGNAYSISAIPAEVSTIYLYLQKEGTKKRGRQSFSQALVGKSLQRRYHNTRL